MVAGRLGLSELDAWAAMLSPAHVGGLMLILRATLLGSAIECGTGFDAADFATRVASGRITHASLVPTMLLRLLEHLKGDALPTGLEAVLVGGAAAPPALITSALHAGIPACTTWGMSEMCSQVSTAAPGESAGDGHSGRPLENLQVRVSGEGELLVAGPTMAIGRLRVRGSGNGGTPHPAGAGGPLEEGPGPKSSLAFEPLDVDGWYPSGDLGHLDAEGRIHVTGRLGDRIISGGVNVDPGMVEATLLQRPGITAALVVGVPDAEWGERVVALVVESPPEGQAVLRPELRDSLRDDLAGATLPRVILSLPSLPLNANGKVDRAAARRFVAEREGSEMEGTGMDGLSGMGD